MEAVLDNIVIEKVHSVSEIQNYLKKVFEKKGHIKAQDVLFLIDIDQTIIVYSDEKIRRKNFIKYSREIKSITKTLNNSHNDVFKLNSLLAALVYDKSFTLNDKSWPDFIRSRLEIGNHVIAFTACIGGKIGNISNFKQYRYNLLKDAGIVFDNFFYGHLYNGMLIAESNTKGAKLAKFLSSIKNLYRPKAIIFIDDSVINLKSCANALKNFDIRYYPIQYEDHSETVSNYDNEDEFKSFLSKAKSVAENCSPDKELMK